MTNKIEIKIDSNIITIELDKEKNIKSETLNDNIFLNSLSDGLSKDEFIWIYSLVRNVINKKDFIDYDSNIKERINKINNKLNNILETIKNDTNSI